MDIMIQDIMQPNVFCVVGEMSVRDLYQELLANGITGAPVLDANDNLIGVVSLSDVARFVAGQEAREGNEFYALPYRGRTARIEPSTIAKARVSDIMTERIHQVTFDSSLEEVLDVFIDEDIHRVIVTHRGHVVGIVTAGDMLRTFREMLDDADFD